MKLKGKNKRKFSKAQVKARMNRPEKIEKIDRGYQWIMNFIDSRVTT